MSRSKRPAVTLGLMACFALTMSACSPPAADGGDADSGDQSRGESVTLRIAGNEYAYTQASIDAFERDNPGVTIEYAGGRIPFEDGVPQALLQSEAGPDVLLVNSGPGRVGLLADAGLILPLDDIYSESDLESYYRPFLLEQLKAQGGGSYFEVVEGIDVFQVHYHTQLFDEAGVEEPETWEELLDACEKLNGAGIQPMVLGARGNFAGGWLFGTLVEASAGAEVMTDVIYNDGSFDRPEMVRAAEMLVELTEAECFDGAEAAAMDFSQMEATFIEAQAAMTVSNQRMIVDASRRGVDVGGIKSFAVPSRDEGRPDRPTAGPSDSWVVNADTPNRDIALKWIKWVSSPEYLTLAIEEGISLIPAQEVGDEVELHPAMVAAIQQLEDGAGYNPSVYFPAEGTQAWYAALQNLITGAATPEDAIAEVAQALERN